MWSRSPTLRCVDRPFDQGPLDQGLSAVVGGRSAAAFTKNLALRTVGDLLSHYPRRYARRGELTALAGLTADEHVTIVAEVLEVTERPMRQRRGSIVEARISDGKGVLTLTFFNQRWRMNELRPGARGIFAGKVTEYRGALQLAHPDYELFEPDADTDPGRAKAWAELPIPIYPATATVPSWKIAQAIGVVLDGLPDIEDPVPESVRDARGLMPFRRALGLVHRPERRGGLAGGAGRAAVPGGLRAAGRAPAAAGAAAGDPGDAA